MILDAIVTSQNHGSGQSQHLLYLGGECPFHISIGIDIVDSFDHFIIGCQNPLVHFGPVSSEFFNLIFHYPKNLIISFTLARINKPKIKIMPVI